MKFAYEPSIFLNSAVEYTVCYVHEDKPDVKIKGRKELDEFLKSHEDYDIVELTPLGFYQMEMEIAKVEGEG